MLERTIYQGPFISMGHSLGCSLESQEFKKQHFAWHPLIDILVLLPEALVRHCKVHPRLKISFI